MQEFQPKLAKVQDFPWSVATADDAVRHIHFLSFDLCKGWPRWIRVLWCCTYWCRASDGASCCSGLAALPVHYMSRHDVTRTTLVTHVWPLQQKACRTELEVIHATSVELHCVRADLSGGSREEAAAEGLCGRPAPGWVRNRGIRYKSRESQDCSLAMWALKGAAACGCALLELLLAVRKVLHMHQCVMRGAAA